MEGTGMMTPGMNNETKATSKVYCKYCEERFDVRGVEFIDIDEDHQGRDLLVFICPGCEFVRSSLIYTEKERTEENVEKENFKTEACRSIRG